MKNIHSSCEHHENKLTQLNCYLTKEQKHSDFNPIAQKKVETIEINYQPELSRRNHSQPLRDSKKINQQTDETLPFYFPSQARTPYKNQIVEKPILSSFIDEKIKPQNYVDTDLINNDTTVKKDEFIVTDLLKKIRIFLFENGLKWHDTD